MNINVDEMSREELEELRQKVLQKLDDIIREPGENDAGEDRDDKPASEKAPAENEPVEARTAEAQEGNKPEEARAVSESTAENEPEEAGTGPIAPAEENRGATDGLSDDIAELEQLVDRIEEREKKLKEGRESRAALAARVAAGLEGTIIKREENKMNKAEERAKNFMETRKNSIPVGELRSVLVSGGTIATPTEVAGINDLLGKRVSSIIDLVSVVNCGGMGANKVAYIKEESGASADQIEGSEAEAREPVFGYVTITPESIACKGQISKQTKKQTPLEYEAKVNAQALKSLRKAVVNKIVKALKDSELVTKVDAKLASNKGVIDEKTLRNIVLAYGGEEDVVGGAVLFLNKADLVAFGDVRGTNEKLPVYKIEPDGENPNMGTIKDGGMVVKYCICSGLTALSGTAKAATDTLTMFYGDPKCFELDLFSDYEVRVSEDFAFTSLMDTIVGDVEVGGDVVVKDGFVAVKIPKT